MGAPLRDIRLRSPPSEIELRDGEGPNALNARVRD